MVDTRLTEWLLTIVTIDETTAEPEDRSKSLGWLASTAKVELNSISKATINNTEGASVEVVRMAVPSVSLFSNRVTLMRGEEEEGID